MCRTSLSKHLYGLLILICAISLFFIFQLAANATTLAELAGTWDFNSFDGGSGAPWWSRGPISINANGTCAYDIKGIDGSGYSGSASFSIASNGIMMNIGLGSLNPLCQVDATNTVMVCTQIGTGGDGNIQVLTKQGASYSMANTDGLTWDGSGLLSTGPTSDETLTWSLTFTDDSGDFTGTLAQNGGTPAAVSGKMSISPTTGRVICVSGSCKDPTDRSFMNAGKTIFVGTSGVNNDTATLDVFTLQGSSYSTADLTGTWEGNTIATGPGAPLWERESLTIYPDGTNTGSYTTSDKSKGSTSGSFTITTSGTSAGAVTWNCADCLNNSSYSGFMDSGKTIMVFTDIWPADGQTAEIKIFTKNAPVDPGAPTNVTAAAGNNQAAVSFTPPASNGKSPITSYTVTSIPAGGIDADAGKTSTIHTVTGLTNTNAYKFTVTATNAAEKTSNASSPSNSVTPSEVPPSSELAGTWNFNNLVSGSDAPWWNRFTMTVNPDGTWTITSGTASDNSSDSGSGGVWWVFPYGITATITEGGNVFSSNILCQADSGNTVLACTETLADGSTELIFGTQQAASYSMADLTSGIWGGNYLSSGQSSGEWARVQDLAYNSTNADFEGSYSDSTKASNTTTWTVALSSGAITCSSGDCSDGSNYSGVMDAGKNIWVGTSGATSSIDPGWFYVFARRAASYSTSDLAGSWQGNSLAAGPGAPWWERAGMTVGLNGTFTASTIESKGPKDHPSGKLAISPDGVVTVYSNGKATSVSGVMDAGKTVMVLTDSWSDGSTEMKIFTKNPGAPDAPTGVSATPGNANATVTFTAPASDGGGTITGYTVTSHPAGGVDANAGKTSTSHTVNGLKNGTAYTFTVKATNAAGKTGPASSPSQKVTPSKTAESSTLPLR